MSFCAAAQEELGESMKAVAWLEKPLLTADMSPAQRIHSRQLGAMLVQSLEGKARDLRRGVVEPGSVLEFWRAISQEYEPQVKNRHAGMLGQILNFRFKGLNFRGVYEVPDADSRIRSRYRGRLRPGLRARGHAHE